MLLKISLSLIAAAVVAANYPPRRHKQRETTPFVMSPELASRKFRTYGPGPVNPFTGRVFCRNEHGKLSGTACGTTVPGMVYTWTSPPAATTTAATTSALSAAMTTTLRASSAVAVQSFSVWFERAIGAGLLALAEGLLALVVLITLWWRRRRSKSVKDYKAVPVVFKI